MPSNFVNITLRAVDLTKGPLNGMKNNFMSLTPVMVGLAAAWSGVKFVDGLIDANSQLEQMKLKLTALTGSAAAGAESVAWIRDFASKNPVRSIEEFGDTFTDLITAKIRPTTKAMEALTGGAIKFGLSSSQMGLVTYALRQIGATAKLTSQDLRQLMAQVPDLHSKMAAALNFGSSEEFQKALEGRKIDSKKAIEAVIKIMGEGSENAIAEGAKTWAGGINKMKLAWFDLQVAIGETGVFDDLKAGMSRLTEFIKSHNKIITFSFSELWNFAKTSLGSVFSDVFDISDGVIINAVQLLGTAGAGLATFANTAVTVGTVIAKLINGMVTAVNKAVQLMVVVANPKDALRSQSSITSELETLQQRKRQAEFSVGIGGIFFEGSSAAEKQAMYDKLNSTKEYVGLLERISTLKGLSGNTVDLGSGFNLDFEAGIQKSLAGMEGIGAAYKTLLTNLRQYQEDNKPDKPIAEAVGVSISAMEKAFDELNLQAVETTGAAVEESTTSFVEGWSAATAKAQADFRAKFGTMKAMGEELGKAITDSFTDGFKKLFDNIADGTLRLKDLVIDVLDAIRKSFTDMLAQQAALALTNGITSFASGLVGNSASANSASMGSGLNDSFMSNAPLQKASGMSKTSVEIINNSGTELKVSEARNKSTTGQQIVSVVIDHIMKNTGGSRDMMRGALA